MRKKVLFMAAAFISSVFLFASTGCMESQVQPKASVDRGVELELPPYNGPKAKVAVANFEWKVGGSGSTTTISGFGGKAISISQSRYSGYTTGLRDMLTTAMVQTKRYRVLERQNLASLQQEMSLTKSGYTDKSGIKKGGIKGADLLIMGAVTGWEPGTSGGGGGLGGGVLGKATAIFGAVRGAFKKSSMAMDIRIVDTHTSEVLAATRVEGEAKDVNLGGSLGVLTGSGGMGGGLGAFAKTPMEKAIRKCIYEAVKYIAANTPKEYMKY
ncbi:MAG: hypothetical protein DRG82_09605 [Deltaproteobacteria bacterium]|nr:MAG: hypothetical protein DRG82_09605 [Deltaproteobacteria bacterium]